MENRYPYSNTGRQLDLIRSEDDEKIYVAVGDDAKETKSTLLWAIKNSGGRKLWILHVHQPPETIPILGRNHQINTLPDSKIKAYRDTEKQLMINALEDCIRFCQKLGVEAQRLYAERESVEKGILEIVHQNMIEPVSKMATYLQLHAPTSCNIWFIYKGQLVYARDSFLRANQHAEKERLVAMQQPSSSNVRNMASSSSGTRTNEWNYNNVEETTEDDSYGPLTRALVESGKCKQQTCVDSTGGLSFQLEAILRLNESESLQIGESRRRKEKEEELEKLNGMFRKITEDLQLAENKTAAYEQKIRDLEKAAMFSSGDIHKGNRGKFIDPCAESSSSRKEIQNFLHELSFIEIIKATCDLDPLLLIREVGYESVYRGKLSETDVAIKILQPDEMQFQKEVEVLSKFRHPNMITLMGVCSEASALAYEYLPNGSLEDRLDCKDNTPSLPWQTRISIATELCSTLIFFHSREPHKLIHAALKPSCIYLDSNFSCKIGDFRSSFMIPADGNSVRDNSIAVNSVYMDPEFVATREVSPDMDVYAYGIILLKLLTGRTALRLVERVKSALADHELEQILDNSAGEWPLWQAKQLAHLGLSCCEHTSDLKLDVWPVLEQMRRMNNESVVASNPSQPDDDPPFYFICPILQEPMKDPHVAADGFTYEAEALREWLNGGHDTSPMTNERLPHLNLVPNLALRSAIKEWQDQRREN
ncbi:hypothetical protein V2J09_002448 [Rumex salicifolius]